MLHPNDFFCFCFFLRASIAAHKRPVGPQTTFQLGDALGDALWSLWALRDALGDALWRLKKPSGWVMFLGISLECSILLLLNATIADPRPSPGLW